jgi:hypothetical protein
MLEKEMQKHHALTNYGVLNENIHLFQRGRMFQGKDKVKVKAHGSSMNASAKHSTKKN